MKHKFAAWIKEATYQVDALQLPRARLDELGWPDFRADPPAATQHLHEFVSTAVELCCFDEEGRWCRLERLLYAFVAAIETVSSIRASETEFAKLYTMCLDGEARMDDIRFWFQVEFPPAAGT